MANCSRLVNELTREIAPRVFCCVEKDGVGKTRIKSSVSRMEQRRLELVVKNVLQALEYRGYRILNIEEDLDPSLAAHALLMLRQSYSSTEILQHLIASIPMLFPSLPQSKEYRKKYFVKREK